MEMPEKTETKDARSDKKGNSRPVNDSVSKGWPIRRYISQKYGRQTHIAKVEGVSLTRL
jgi:hypothetical protein